MIPELPDFIRKNHADAVALGVHTESMLHRFGMPLHLFNLPVEQLLKEANVPLFTVH